MAHGPLGQRVSADRVWETFRTTWIRPEGGEQLALLVRPMAEMSDESEFVEMFIAEAKILRLLDHPNVVRLLEIGETEGFSWLLFEYVEGKTLEEVVQTAREKGVAIPRELSAWIVAAVARGLRHAHELRVPGGEPLGILHRDVSPRHVRLGWDGSVRIGGFAQARAESRIMSSALGLIIPGRFAYMSPEQVTGHTLTPLTDVFSCGVLLYELTLGVLPFRGESEFEILQRIRENKPAPPASVDPAFDPRLAHLIDRCLKLLPSRISVGDLDTMLGAWLGMQPDPGGPRAITRLLRTLYDPEALDRE